MSSPVIDMLMRLSPRSVRLPIDTSTSKSFSPSRATSLAIASSYS